MKGTKVIAGVLKYAEYMLRMERSSGDLCRNVEGYDTCHCLGPFTALQHSCMIILLSDEEGMCVLFKFPGLERVYSIYRIYVYSVIDPSGDLYIRLVACC